MIRIEDIDFAPFNEAMGRVQEMVNATAAEVLPRESRFFAETLIRLTRPAKQAQGRKRIEKDMSRVYVAITDMGTFINPHLDLAYQMRGVAALLPGSNGQGILYSIGFRGEIGPFDRERHRGRRGRDGRVKPSGSRLVVTNPAALRNYIKERQKNVGMLKAGWLPAVSKFGGKAPAWITRHGDRFGKILDDSLREADPEIQLTNLVDFARYKDPDIIERAISIRARAMVKAAELELKRRLEAGA